MTAGVIMLGAYGKIDMYLSYKPQITFFKIVYKRHTYFSQELLDQFFITSPNFGIKTSCIIFNNADLISDMYLVLKLPAIPVNTRNDIVIRWVDYIGLNLIKRIDIEIGNKLIQKIDSDYLYYFLQLRGFQKQQKWGSHRRGVEYLLGQRPELTEFSSGKDSATLVIPIPFWFTTSTGKSLPLSSINHSQVKVNLEVNKLSEVIEIGPTHQISVKETVTLFKKYEYIYQNSTNFGIFIRFDANTKTLYFNQLQGSFIASTITIDKELMSPMTENNLIRNQAGFFMQPSSVSSATNYTFKATININDCKLQANYVYLDNNERARFYSTNQQYLIEQQQYYTNTQVASYNNRVLLNFVNPCVEMLWYLRLNRNISCKRIYSYTQNVDNSGDTLLKSSAIVLNGTDVMSKRNSTFTETIEIVKYHPTSTLGEGVHIYTFGLVPENFQPSGTCNFSRIEKAYLDFTTTPVISYDNKATLKVIATTYNILQIENGIVSLEFDD